jgi:hypothetical protein
VPGPTIEGKAPVPEIVPNPPVVVEGYGQVPTPGQVPEPMRVPEPVRGPVTEITVAPVTGVVTQTVTPGEVVDVGESVVTPAVTTEGTTQTVTSVVDGTATATPGPTTSTPTDVGVATTVERGPTTTVTHKHATPSVKVVGSTSAEHQAPEGELAHTAGNTAMLAIVAGSLLAAGAGLAVAGRMGKDDPDTGATEG